MLKSTLIGFGTGILLLAAFWMGGPYQWESWTLKLVVFIDTPIAYLISWIKGWPMEQEAAIYCYALSSVITIPLLGALVGLLVAIIKRQMRRRSQQE